MLLVILETWITWIKFLVSLDPLSNIEVTKYFNYQPRVNVDFSRDNLPRIKDGANVLNRDDKQSKGAHWFSLFIDRNTAAYFHSFGIEHIPQKVFRRIKDKSIIHNMFRVQGGDSIVCGFYCTAFIEYMIAGTTLLHYTNLYYPADYKQKQLSGGVP